VVGTCSNHGELGSNCWKGLDDDSVVHFIEVGIIHNLHYRTKLTVFPPRTTMTF
jgi:hypothetical protein